MLFFEKEIHNIFKLNVSVVVRKHIVGISGLKYLVNFIFLM